MLPFAIALAFKYSVLVSIHSNKKLRDNPTFFILESQVSRWRLQVFASKSFF